MARRKPMPFPDKPPSAPVAVGLIQIAARQPVSAHKVDGDFASLNDAIGARWGTVVPVLTKHAGSYHAAQEGLRLSLWVADEGAGLPANPHASALAGTVLHGDAVAFCSKGSEIVPMPDTVLGALRGDLGPKPVAEIRPLR